MSKFEDSFKKAVEAKLGKFVPNQFDMNCLSSYMYKMFVIVMRDANMQEEYKNITPINPNDENGFEKAIRDISLFTSQNVLYESIRRAYGDVRREVGMVKIDSSNKIEPNINKSRVSSSEGDFSDIIDMSKVELVDKSELFKAMKSREDEQKSQKRVLQEFSLPELESAKDEINSNTSNMLKSSSITTVMNSGLSDNDVFSTVMDIPIDLDY